MLIPLTFGLCQFFLPYRLESMFCNTPKEPEEIIKEVPEPIINSNFTNKEQIVIEKLKENGITDKNAVAVFLGNIKQESNFNSQSYNSREDAYGIFQWRLGRQNRLQLHCKVIEDFSCQVDFVFTESDWKNIEVDFKLEGKSIREYNHYMRQYLRYGHEGDRVNYAKDYVELLP